MIDKEKVKTAIRQMTENNRDWHEIIKDAPAGAKLRIAIAFYASTYLDQLNQKEKDEYREFRELYEKQLTGVDLRYLAESFNRMGLDAAYNHYLELFDKLPDEEKQKGEKEYAEIVHEEARQDDTAAKTNVDDGPAGEQESVEAESEGEYGGGGKVEVAEGEAEGDKGGES